MQDELAEDLQAVLTLVQDQLSFITRGIANLNAVELEKEFYRLFAPFTLRVGFSETWKLMRLVLINSAPMSEEVRQFVEDAILHIDKHL